jgi:N-acetylmuramoyl-L-alanine amidase
VNLNLHKLKQQVKEEIRWQNKMKKQKRKRNKRRVATEGINQPSLKIDALNLTNPGSQLSWHLKITS